MERCIIPTPFSSCMSSDSINLVARARYTKGRAAEEAGHFSKAAAAYREVAALEPGNPELWVRLALARGTIVRVDTDRIRSVTRTTFVRNAYGAKYRKANAEVEGALQQARACPATTAGDLYWRGVAACLSGEPAAAGMEFAASVELDADQTLAWYYLGLTRRGEATQPTQLECFNHALAADAGNAPCLLSRAVLHLFEGQLDNALADFEASLRLRPDAEAAQWRGLTRFLLHDFDGALADFGVWEGRYNSGGWRSLGYEVSLPEAYDDTLFLGWAGLGGRPEDLWKELRSRWSAALDAFEQAGVGEPHDACYLSERFSDYFFNGWERYGPAHYPRALHDAGAVLSTDVENEHGQLRQMRTMLRVKANDLDFAALLADYKWLLERAETVQANPAIYQTGINWQFNPELPPLYRPHYAHCCAWALYHLGDLAGSRQYCAAAMALEVPLHFGFDNRWLLTERPPVPDDEYLLWQVRQQLPLDDPHAYRWLYLALWTLPEQMVGELADAFWYYIRTHPWTLQIMPVLDDYTLEGCVQFCQEQLDKAPAAVLDLHQLLYQLVLQVQRSKRLTGLAASPASDAAVL